MRSGPYEIAELNKGATGKCLLRLSLCYGSFAGWSTRLRVNQAWCFFLLALTSLKLLTFQENIHRKIGTDLSVGVEYRPLLSNNIIMKGGISTLLPGQGFRDIYNGIRVDINPLLAVFLDITLTY